MFAGKKCWRLAIALSLAVVIVANGAPAVGNCDEGFVAGAWSANTDEHITFSSQSGQVGGTYNPHLPRIGEEFPGPPAGPADSPASDVGIKSLPSVPAMLFVVLTGFLCVSFVKDRRVVSYSAVVLHPSLRVSNSGSGSLRTSAVGAHLALLESAMVGLASDTIKSTSCLACAAEQPVCFSPAFIFSNLARGPPKSA
jgi:hypothetical protein